MHAGGAAVCAFLFGDGLLGKLTRARIKYGLQRAAIIWKAYYNNIFRRLSGLIEVSEGIIKACAIVNSNSNKEYKRVAWKVNERDNNVWIIHALAVRYEYRGMGLAT